MVLSDEATGSSRYQAEANRIPACSEGVCLPEEGFSRPSYAGEKGCFQEIVDDSMLTYDNYYGINREKDPERYDTIRRRNIDAMLKEVISDEGVDPKESELAGYAKNYLLRIGMDEPTIDRLKEHLIR